VDLAGIEGAPAYPRVLGKRGTAAIRSFCAHEEIDSESTLEGGTVARRVRHRRLLAEPDLPPKRPTVREGRAALRALLDLPPSREGLTEPGPFLATIRPIPPDCVVCQKKTHCI
jgi:hypothetical protein